MTHALSLFDGPDVSGSDSMCDRLIVNCEGHRLIQGHGSHCNRMTSDHSTGVRAMPMNALRLLEGRAGWILRKERKAALMFSGLVYLPLKNTTFQLSWGNMGYMSAKD